MYSVYRRYRGYRGLKVIAYSQYSQVIAVVSVDEENGSTAIVRTIQECCERYTSAIRVLYEWYVLYDQAHCTLN